MGSPPPGYVYPPQIHSMYPYLPTAPIPGGTSLYDPNLQGPPPGARPGFPHQFPMRNCEPDVEVQPPPMGFVHQPHLLSYAPELAVSHAPPDRETHTQHADLYCKIPGYRWVGASSSDCSFPGAVLVGTDQDGSPIYAGRAYHEGDLIPAKVIPCKTVAYIAYGGVEHMKDQFEILVTDEVEASTSCCCLPCFGVLVQTRLNWQWAASGEVPHNAVEVGRTTSGEPLFFGRVHRDGAVTPGKIQRSHGCCYFPFNGEEMSSTDYEVLVME